MRNWLQWWLQPSRILKRLTAVIVHHCRQLWNITAANLNEILDNRSRHCTQFWMIGRCFGLSAFIGAVAFSFSADHWHASFPSLISFIPSHWLVCGKGGKGLWKGGAKRHRKVLRDNIQGITKRAIRHLTKRGGVNRISCLIYEGPVVSWRFSWKTSLETLSHTPRERRSQLWMLSTHWRDKAEPCTVSENKSITLKFKRSFSRPPNKFLLNWL
jgi:hypothetical protein